MTNDELKSFTEVSEDQVKVFSPFRWLVVGASGSGKSVFVKNAISNPDLFQKGKFKKIYYFTRIPEDNLKDLDPSIEVFNYIPSLEEFKELALPYKGERDVNGNFVSAGSCMIIDDFGQSLPKSLSTIFQVLSRHLNASVFLILQCLFSSNPLYREISLNSTQITIFRNIRDKQQIKTFARQFCDGDCNWVKEVYSHLCQYPFTYLHFDLSQECPENLRIRTNLFDKEGYITVFTEKKS